MRPLDRFTIVFLCGAWGLFLIHLPAAVLSEAPMWESLFGWFGRDQGLLLFGAGACLATVVASLDRDEVHTVVKWLLVAGLVAAGVSFLQLLGWDALRTSGTPGISATLGNPNFAAAYFGMLLGPTLGLALADRQRGWWHFTGIASAGCFAAMAVLTGALQGVLISVCVGVTLGLWCGLAWLRGRSTRSSAPVVVALGGVVGAGVLLLLASWPRLMEEPTFAFRAVQWRTALAAIADSPWVGHGVDGISRVVGRFRPPEYLDFRSADNLTSNVHNVPLQLAATAGVLAGALWIVIVVASIAAALHRVLRRPLPIDYLLAGLVAGVVGYLLHAMVSIDMPALFASGICLAALTVSRSRSSGASVPPATSRDVGTPRVGGGVSLTTSALVCWPLAAGVGALLAWQATSVHNFLANDDPVEVASLIQEDWLPCDLRASRAMMLSEQPSREGLSTLQQAWAVDPTCPRMNQAVARAASRVGDADAAIAASRAFAGSDPWNVEAHLLEVYGALLANDEEGALLALEDAERVGALRPSGSDEQLRALRQALRAAQGSAG
jgi:O-antigen ligase